MPYLDMPDPDLFTTAIRSSVNIWYTVDATFAGAPVTAATGMRPTGGSITDTTKPGVRRVLNLDVAAEAGRSSSALYDALSPIGTTLTVTGHVELTDRTVVDIPMGVFDVDQEKLSESNGIVSLTAPDKWVRIQRARFFSPTQSTPSLPVRDQITALIRGALGAGEPVNMLTSNGTTIGALTWEKDRDKAIIDIAASIGVWVYFDRNGVATVADLPTFGASADWLIDASASGVLTELDRERSRTAARNMIVVSSSAADGELFPTQYIWDNDPTSPTYAGPNPVDFPDDLGPFGVVTMYWDTPILDSIPAARAAGSTILARVAGLASSVSLGSVPNPAIDAFDTLDVLPPGWRTVLTGFSGGGFGGSGFGTSGFGVGSRGVPLVRYTPTQNVERHIADTVTHPLTDDQAQHIDGRSTRSDEPIEGGS